MLFNCQQYADIYNSKTPTILDLRQHILPSQPPLLRKSKDTALLFWCNETK